MQEPLGAYTSLLFGHMNTEVHMIKNYVYTYDSYRL